MRRILDYLDQNGRVRDDIVARWAKSLPPNTRVLDVGAGNCRYEPLFNHCQYQAQDHPDVPYADESKKVLRSDICAIPLSDASIDALICTEVLEHVADPLRAIEEFARLVKPGGQLFLSVPAACRVHRVPTHYWGGFAPDFFEHSLPERGFALDRLEPLGNWSIFMAQELSRFPSVIRDSSRLPSPLRQLISASTWPAFRVVLPAAFIAFSKLDTSDDLPLGWMAYATRKQGLPWHAAQGHDKAGVTSEC